MIVGIGIDLCAISRMEPHVREGRFLQRYCTQAEREYIAARGPLAGHSLAACFAAKEAFAKALGRGIDGFSLTEIEVAHSDAGAPRLVLHGKALLLAQEKGAVHSHLSLSHDGDTAAAVVILEGV